ncbi:MAG: hypothetical protein IJM63_08050 [Solobacterium sp.]|nr:hypothetical protein [Solobacterium sp.]
MNKETLATAAVNAIIIGLIGYVIQAYLMKVEQGAAFRFALLVGAAAGLGYYLGRKKPKQ